MFHGPGSDSWLQPPEPRTPPSGDATTTIERPVPHVGAPEDGWREYEVSLEMDEGSVYSATVTHEWAFTGVGRKYCAVRIAGGDVELTDAERESAEVAFAEDAAQYPDEPDSIEDMS